MSGLARAVIEAPPRREGPRRSAAADERALGPTGPLGWQELRQRRRGLQPAGSGSGRATRLTLVLVALYALTFTTISFRLHDAFQTDAFDLGNFDQAVWNTWQGRPFQFSNWEGGTSRLAAHVEPSLLLIAPLYGLWASPKMLLLVQGVAMALGALPAAWLARRRLQSDAAAVALAAAYLFYPALEAANLAEFHPVALAAPLLLFAFDFLDRGWPVPFLVAASLAMTTKEHVPLGVAVMGWYAWQHGRKALGLTTVALALTWLTVAFVIVLPSHNPQGASPYLDRYTSLGSSPLEVARTVVTEPKAPFELLLEPNRLRYLATLLAPLGFLPLLSPATLAMALPDVALNLLSNFPAQYGFQAHYGAVVAPFLVISAILGAGALARLLRGGSSRAAAVFLALVVLALSLQSAARHIWAPLLDHTPRVTQHERRATSVLAQLPKDAAVAATSGLNPHLSQRERLSRFPDLGEADYIAIDVTGTPYPLDPGSQWYHVQQLLQGEWGVIAGDDGVVLLKRGHAAKDLPDRFFSFTRVTTPKPRVATQANFGPGLQLLGYDLEPGATLHGADPYARLVLYFRGLGPIEGDPRLLVQVRQPDGTVFEQYHTFAATAWHPMRLWQAGDAVRVAVDRVAIGWLPEATVWLSVMQGDDPATAARLLVLAPRLRVEEGAVRLLELRRG